jgi:hypothetical protein
MQAAGAAAREHEAKGIAGARFIGRADTDKAEKEGRSAKNEPCVRARKNEEKNERRIIKLECEREESNLRVA